MFLDRNEAGQRLGLRLLAEPLVSETEPALRQVLSIPRGGVVVGAAVARALACAHDVIVVKKLGFPGQAELAIGAVAEDGVVVLDEETLNWYELEAEYLEQEIERVKARIRTYTQKFRQGRPLDVRAGVAILVDDGVATGETMKAAIKWIGSRERPQQPATLVVAVPVCSPRAAAECGPLVDKLISLSTPTLFWAVGQFYQEFDQVDDDEVMALLKRGNK